MHNQFERVYLTVIDGVGCGEAADTRTHYPEDIDTNSLVNASRRKPLDALALQGMGLGHVPGLEEMQTITSVPLHDVRGAFGALEPTFAGNGSPEGHQALAGWH